MNIARRVEQIQTVIIGAGQAGLSVGYHLARRGLPFVILEANPRIGDSWRRRWDSLRLFTPAKFDGLDGMPFPAPRDSFPTKDEMADYLESYARHFNLPVRTGVKVDRLSRRGTRYIIETHDGQLEADHVVVAMASYQAPRVPAFARELDANIVQLHSVDYKNTQQLRAGGVLIVGAGNSGAEIAKEVAQSHRTWISGRDVGQVPFRVNSALGRVLLPFMFRFVFHRLLTVNTPLGRKIRPTFISKGGPLIRVKSRDLTAAGVERVPRVAGVKNGQPLLEDGRVLDVANVIWSTGFFAGMSWIALPVIDSHQEPIHKSGIVTGEPGLYFVGLHFLHSLSSTMIHGVGRDADRVAGTIATRVATAPARPARAAAVAAL